jgi:hypothetical protein
MTTIRDLENTADIEIELDPGVRAVVNIYGPLTSTARGKLIALLQALPVVAPPPPPPEPPRQAIAEEYIERPVQKKP